VQANRNGAIDPSHTCLRTRRAEPDRATSSISVYAKSVTIGALQGLRGGQPAVLGGLDRGLELGLTSDQNRDLVAGARIGRAVGEPGRERGALVGQPLQLALGGPCGLAQWREPGAHLRLALALRPPGVARGRGRSLARRGPIQKRASIVLEIALERPDAAVRDQPQPVRGELDQVRIVTDQQDRAGKAVDREGESIARIDVEVVGRLVEHQ
jgi:hypothetical protein